MQSSTTPLPGANESPSPVPHRVVATGKWADLSPESGKVYVVICHYAGLPAPDSEWFLLPTLCREAGVNWQWAAVALAELETAGLITWWVDDWTFATRVHYALREA